MEHVEKEHQLGTHTSKWHKEKVPRQGMRPRRPNPSRTFYFDFLLLVMSVWFDKIVQYCDFKSLHTLSRYVPTSVYFSAWLEGSRGCLCLKVHQPFLCHH